MEGLVIFGDGLFAELACFYFTHDSPYEVACFTVDREYINKGELLGLPVVPFDIIENVFPPSRFKMIVSVSFQRLNRLREERYFQSIAKGYDLINFISSRSSTWPGLVIGKNSVIGENSSVQPFVTIGNNVIVTSSVVIGHHAVLEDHSFVGPGAVLLGGVVIGAYAFIAANATIKEGIRIGRECVIGSGVSITRDTQPGGIYLNRPPKGHSGPNPGGLELFKGDDGRQIPGLRQSRSDITSMHGSRSQGGAGGSRTRI
ncbi:MAG TPA: acetyltransferase [Syntrophorhabdaceae bacterium]|jgi:sugar O-acyltransferase (sialic acid O-acetyltransferase NeuD family)